MEKIELKHPVTVGDGSLLKSIDMRRPTIGDVIASKVKLGEGDIEGEMRLMAKLCGMVPEDMKLLDLADYMALNGQLARFLG